MGLLRDWNFVETATRIPALREIVREALIRAIFTRDDRVLPPRIVAGLTRSPGITVKVKDEAEIRKLVQVANESESSVSLGLSPEDYHYFRRELSVGKDRDIGILPRARALLTYDWLVPEPRGILLDFSAYRAIDIREGSHRAVAQVGATWKELYDTAQAHGQVLPFVPTVPFDFAVGDGVWGDAPFGSYPLEFGDWVQAIRAISAFGHRARLGFEEVAVEGSGYDLLHALLPYADEFVLPTEVAVRLWPKPEARKVLTYAFDDPKKLATALDKLVASPWVAHWVHIADSGAASVLRPGTAPEAFTVQIAMGGTQGGIAAREKAFDGLMAGFKAKTPDTANPFDVPADAYRKTAERVERSLFVGEVRMPIRSFPVFHGLLKEFGKKAIAATSVYASLRSTGTISAFPAFESSKERRRLYELSLGVADLAKRTEGAMFVSRISHLWQNDPGYRRRMELLTRLKMAVDTPRILQPFVLT